MGGAGPPARSPSRPDDAMRRKIAVGLFLAATFNRLLESWVIGWGVVRDPRAQKEVWLYPIRDLLGFAVWCASYLSKSAVWRDRRFQLVRGGRIVLREGREKLG